MESSLKYTCLFGGGAIRGLAYVGAIRAMEELGVETNMIQKNENSKFITDCTIETDKPAFIPDDYIDVTSEKIRIYRAMDSMSTEKEINNYIRNIQDRFGKMPEELDNLFNVVKIKNIGERIGFEKVIIKNGLLIAFFISNQMSPYYKSKTFERVMSNIIDSKNNIEIKQTEGKFKILVRNVSTLEQAHLILSKLR